MSASTSATEQPAPRHSGLAFGLACYGMWGLLPLFFNQLEFASDLEIIAHRTLWSLPLCIAILAVTGKLAQVRDILRRPRQLGFMALAAILIGANWLTYVYAVNHGQVLQASLGYFANPLLTVLLGVVVLRERLRRLQWVAVGIGLAAVLVIAIGDGEPPWIALGLAFTFGLYGLSKSYAGRTAGAVASLATETLILAPLAVIALGWLAARGQTHFASHGATSMALLASSGIVTAVPLIFFAAAARRLPLSVMGLLQYLAPVLQFIIGVTINHEPMPPNHWVGFGIIWLALVLLTTDALLHTRRQTRMRRLQATGTAA